tara:strand:- start:17 stop:196 length:180 start_codon:yes stop_codon:yes gene_type:complete
MKLSKKLYDFNNSIDSATLSVSPELGRDIPAIFAILEYRFDMFESESKLDVDDKTAVLL